MKIFSLCYLLLSTPYYAISMDNDTIFYNKVLNDFSNHSYFLHVQIKSKEYSGDAIIENESLFYFLYKTRKINKMDYVIFMKNAIMNNDTLSIGDYNLEEWGFSIVSKSEEVDSIAYYGIDSFIRHYFIKNVMIDGVSDEKRSSIILWLFKWKIPSKIDDETGFLIISY